jgi:hypothetical protein
MKVTPARSRTTVDPSSVLMPAAHAAGESRDNEEEAEASGEHDAADELWIDRQEHAPRLSDPVSAQTVGVRNRTVFELGRRADVFQDLETQPRRNAARAPIRGEARPPLRALSPSASRRSAEIR